MREERDGFRDQSYSAWHRTRSIARYVGIERAQTLSMVDQDATLFCELDSRTREPLALIEVAMDVGQREKSASSMGRLAARATLPAYVVLYSKASSLNPADRNAFDIDGFRVMRVWPAPEATWRSLTPAEWASALVSIRSWSAARVDAANDSQWEPVPQQANLFD